MTSTGTMDRTPSGGQPRLTGGSAEMPAQAFGRTGADPYALPAEPAAAPPPLPHRVPRVLASVPLHAGPDTETLARVVASPVLRPAQDGRLPLHDAARSALSSAALPEAPASPDSTWLRDFLVNQAAEAAEAAVRKIDEPDWQRALADAAVHARLGSLLAAARNDQDVLAVLLGTEWRTA